MRAPLWTSCRRAALAGALVAGTVLAGASSSLAAAGPVAHAGVRGAAPVNSLSGVAVTPGGRAWAVGYSAGPGGASTLIEAWTGVKWAIVASPNGGNVENILNAVAATSGRDAWAVGSYAKGGSVRTLIEHWNGVGWKLVPSPNAGGTAGRDVLNGVAATSPDNAWAVGQYWNGHALQTLIEHWNGRRWTLVRSPDPGGPDRLDSLSAVTATLTTAWAVGSYKIGPNPPRTLTEEWADGSWHVVPSPSPGAAGAADSLSGVAAGGTGVWAVGRTIDPHSVQGRPLAERWTGQAWQVAPSQNPGGVTPDNLLSGVAVGGPSKAWAVGTYQKGNLGVTLVEHLVGGTWRAVPSPNVGGPDYRNAVAASSSTAWAVGQYAQGTSTRTLIERWTLAGWTITPSPNR